MSAFIPAYIAFLLHGVAAVGFVGVVIAEDDSDMRRAVALLFLLNAAYAGNLWWGGFFEVLFK